MSIGDAGHFWFKDLTEKEAAFSFFLGPAAQTSARESFVRSVSAVAVVSSAIWLLSGRLYDISTSQPPEKDTINLKSATGNSKEPNSCSERGENISILQKIDLPEPHLPLKNRCDP